MKKIDMKKKVKQVLAILIVIGMLLPMFRFEANAMSYSGSKSYQSGKYYTRLTNVKLTGDQRTDIVNIAKSQVGYQEGSSSSQLSGTSYGGKNYTEYGRWYGLQDMWCAMFVSWCANTAGVSSSVVPKHCFTPTGLQWFKDRGRAYSRKTVANGGYTPKAGDIIYFKSSRNNNSTNHVGIVTKYSNRTVYTVEGNTSSATISTNGGAVCEKSYSIDNTYIVYICSPAYKSSGSTSSGSSSSTSSSSTNWLSGDAKSIVFNAAYYSDTYADLKKAFGTNESKLFNHFLNYGIKEGRCASPIFDIKYYVSNNADLKKAFGSDYVAAMKHFAKNGINEARATAKPVDIGTNFKAKINYSAAGLNLSLSDTNVITYQPSDKPAQIWTFNRQSDGSYEIVNSKNGYCLEAAGTSAKANVRIAKDNDSKKQRWFIYEGTDGRYIIRSVASSGCVVDIYNGSKEALANVQLYTYNGTAAQQFAIKKLSGVETNSPVDMGKEFYAKIGASEGKNLSLSGDNVIIFGTSKAPAQLWRFVRQSDGSYEIINQKKGTILTVTDSKDASGTNVVISADKDAKGQRWFIYKSGSEYMLRPACSTTCVLDVAGNGTADMTNVQIYKNNNSDAQKFTISKVDNYFNAVSPADIGTNFYGKISSELGKNLSLSGDNVILYPASDKPAQKWLFSRQSDGSYKIVNSKNDKVLAVASNSSKAGANVKIEASNNKTGQRWFIYLKEGKYVFRPACATNNVLTVEGGKTADLTNIETNTFNNSKSQKYTVILSETAAETASSNMVVLRKIIYAVETGGQVYGKCDYADFTEAYTNSSSEHAITIGAGQWYGTEAKTLLNLIRKTDPVTFSKLDTAGIASDLDKKDWSKYKLSKTSTKAKCIQKIISSEVGKKCQDQLIDEQMAKYMKEAKDLGVNDEAAQMMCANIRHQGGLSAVKRVLKKTEKPYTIHTIYEAMKSDTGNQVGAYRSRQLMVYNSLKKYVK